MKGCLISKKYKIVLELIFDAISSYTIIIKSKFEFKHLETE